MKNIISQVIYPLELRSTKDNILHANSLRWAKEAIKEGSSLSPNEQLALAEDALVHVEAEVTRCRGLLFVMKELAKKALEGKIENPKDYQSLCHDIGQKMFQEEEASAFVVLDLGNPDLATCFRNMFESYGENELIECAKRDGIEDMLPHGFIYPNKPDDDSEACDFIPIKAVYFN